MHFRIAALCLATAALPAHAAQPAVEMAAPLSHIDPATVTMPKLDFIPSEADRSDYEKYFYFHRADTDFDTALADVRECDQYARGPSYTVASLPIYNYGMAGAVGGAIGGAVADAIFGSAQRRKMRRAVLKTCMKYKEYTAYGLNRDLWTRFNFEEGNSSPPEDKRQAMLRMQARVASGPTPIGEKMQ